MADETDTTQQQSGTYDNKQDVGPSKSDYVKRWVDAIELAGKEEQDWRKVTDEARKVYESDEATTVGTAFNIYHANIETLCPALYNSQPIPDIRRRYNDRDPAAKEGADVIERVLSYSVDEYDFNGVMEECVFDLAISGRGQGRVRYIPTLTNDGQDVGAQSVTCETTPWAAFRRGPARRWADVPWVAFGEYLSREELTRLNPQIGPEVKLDLYVDANGDEQKDAKQDKPESDIFKRCLVWQIWDRLERKVRYIAPTGYPEDQIAEIEDPLNLKGFFPCPKPMYSGKMSGRLVPLSPYKIYKPLLDEIDLLSRRITRLIKQLRPRALLATNGPGTVDLKLLSEADDGEMVEVANVVQFLESGGLEKLMAWFPLDPIIKAISELYVQREAVKQQLFEVSGLADIMRGQSNPNETKGAQDLKQRWGSLRLQKQQAEVQRFARDLFRLKAEIIAEKFTPENLSMMSGIQLDQPALQVITNQKMRDYRIDIESDSTIRGDLTRNQEAMAQFVQGTAQYFQALAPVVETGAVSGLAAVTIYSAFARNFKLGREVDTVLDGLAEEAAKAEQVKKNQPPPKDPATLKAEAEIAAKQQKAQVDTQLASQKMQHDQQMAVQEARFDEQNKAREMAFKERLAMMEFAAEQRMAQLQFSLDARIAQLEATLKAQTARQDNEIKRDNAETQRKVMQQKARQPAK